MPVNDRQVRRLFDEQARNGNCTRSALKAGICRPTAAKYLRAGKLPSELRTAHTWRTRVDPFATVPDDLIGMLEVMPNLPATMALSRLQYVYPGGYGDGQLRTLQRRFRAWRACAVPKEVFFEQIHRPGKWLQIDWTRADELGVTIRGMLFRHLLCHAVFPFSNREWATICGSENFLSLQATVRETLNLAQGVPDGLQLDNSSTVTHRVGEGAARDFNAPFRRLLDHYGLNARTINIRSPNENGDIESAHRHFLLQLDIALGFRGGRDFES